MGRQKGLEWEHVVIQVKNAKGTHLMKCKYCNHVFVGGPHRIRAHILGIRGQGVEKCTKASDIVRSQLRNAMGHGNDHLNSDVQTDVNGNTSVNVDADMSTDASISSSISMNKMATKKQKIEASGSLPMSFELALRKQAEEAVARFFYAEDIAHRKVESSFFHDMLMAVSKVGPSFKAPSAYQLRKKYLNGEVVNVERDLIMLKDSWKTYGCTIVSDGWSDTRNRPIINVLASSLHGTMFLKSIDTSGHVKTGEYIFKILKDAILEVGPSNVVQVCMDNAANCVVAGHMIEKEWPSIIYTRCTCHCVDLLLEDIAKCAWIDAILRSAMKITGFITRKQYALAMFRKFSGKDLLKPSTTRFSYSFIVLSNLLDDKVYGGLRRMVVSEQWCNWNGAKTKKAEEMVSIVLDANFWADVKMIVKVCKPVLKLLRLTDREGATMGLIYQFKQQMLIDINNMTEIDPMKLDEIKECCIHRLTMLESPLHAAGYVLHPLWTANGQEIDHDLQMGWMKTVMLYANGNIVLQNALIDEFYAYRKQASDLFQVPFAKDANRLSTPIKWWETFGASTPNLTKLAIRILSQGTSASSCERNWSTFSLIHTKRRNRLSSNHVQKLVFLHTNLRILKKIKERGFNPIEITIEMIEKENDEERLLVLQSEQEAQQVDENESLTNVMAYIDDNAQDEDEDDDFDDDDITLNED